MLMGKQRIDIEYPLTTKSPNIIWEQISSAHGLGRWLADHVTEEDGIFTFTWGEPWTQQDIRKAHLIEYVKYDHIRLKWDYDDEMDEERDGRGRLLGDAHREERPDALPHPLHH